MRSSLTEDTVKGEDKQRTEDQSKALQLALEGVNKRINNLITLKISPDNSDGSLLSDTESAERKLVFLQEKDKVTEQLLEINLHTNWVETVKEGFNFALNACKRFKRGVLKTKIIARTVGSNLILFYKNCNFSLDIYF